MIFVTSCLFFKQIKFEKPIRKFWKILKTVLVTLLILTFTTAIALQSPAVQTFLVQSVTKYLSPYLDGDIQIEKIHFRPFNTILLKNVAILDKHPYVPEEGEKTDTLFHARYIAASCDLKGLLKGELLHFGYARVTDGSMTLVVEPYGKDSTKMNLNRIFQIKPSNKPKQEPKDIFEIGKVKIDNFRFRMKNFNPVTLRHKALKPYVPETIDWSDLDVKNIQLKGHDLSMKKGVVAGVVESLSFREKSGYVVHHIEGSTQVGNGKTLIEDLTLQDDWSDLHIPHLAFQYKNTKSWSNFEEEVHIDGTVARPTVLNLHSISYFAGALKKMSFTSELHGKVDGLVNDLHVHQLHINTLDSQVSGILDGKLAQVTLTDQMHMDVQARQLSFTTEGLGKFIHSWAPATHLDLSRFAPGQQLILDAEVKGPLNNFNVDGTIQHGQGKLMTQINIQNVALASEPIHIGGKLQSKDLHLGQITNVAALGECSLKSRFSSELGEEPKLQIDSLTISRLKALDYNYSGIVANGTYSNNTFDGKVLCKDPNLKFLFQGIFTTPSKKVKNLIYRFYANLIHADLQALNIDKRNVSRIRFQTNTNFNHVKDGNILGQIAVNNLYLEDSNGLHKIGDIVIDSQVNDDVNRIRLKAPFAEGYFIGSEFLGAFIKDLQRISTYRNLPALHKSPMEPWTGNRYKADIKFHDCTDILSYLVPGFYIADSTHLSLDINSEGELNTRLKSRRLAYRDKYIKGIELKLNNKDHKMTGRLNAQELSVSPLLIQNNQIDISAEHNQVGLDIQFENEASDINKGNLHLTAQFQKDEKDSLTILASILPSQIYFHSKPWKFHPSEITLAGQHIQVNQFQLTNQEQLIQIDGGYSKTQHDTLDLNLEKFDLSLLNHFIKPDLQLQSKATGFIKIISPSSNHFGVLVNMRCDSTYLANEEIGTLNLKSAWDDIDRCFKYHCDNSIQGARTLDIRGKFFPSDKSIDASIWLNGLNFAYAKPFLNTVFDDIQGYLSGNVAMKGPFKKLDISGENLRIGNGYLVVGFTKVPYYLDGPLTINNHGLFFENVDIKDNYGAKGLASGGILWNHLKDFKMDTHLKFAELEALKTGLSDNPSFYGHVFGTGTVDITGPFNALLIEVNANTTKNGKIHVPLSNSATSGTSNLLTFKKLEIEEYVDPYELMIKKLKKEESSTNNLGVRLKINVNPNTQAVIEVDKETGNVLNGWGKGYMDLEIMPSKDIFNINGDFNIVGGNYHFGALGVAYRDFTLQNGGTIKFNGDIMESDLNLTALYKTKSNIGVLIADTTSMSRRQVNCSIGISGKIKNPRIKFGIEVPDLDPTTQARVESALSTEDKMQKQFLSLLLSNSFLPDEQSGIVSNNALLYSNVTEIMSSQLNNILQKLNIPVDLGLDYQQGNNGKNAFDVAVSTELFNNRVLVNGTFGSRQYNNTNNQNNEFVGDLDIEIKLDKTGAVRLNLFSHSADQYSNYLDNSQRSGVGITYQHEFNTFKEFFRDMFKSKKKKEAEKRTLQNMNRDEEKTVIEIQAEDPSKKRKKKR